MSADLVRHELVGGEIIRCHTPEQCAGETCCIHNPSDHHMKNWPQHWRADRGIMERICPHGVGHPDPDDLTEDTVHGCDSCCNPGRRHDENDYPLTSSLPKGEWTALYISLKPPVVEISVNDKVIHVEVPR
jgi:hypothetical protein